jgi:hypothetical protein
VRKTVQSKVLKGGRVEGSMRLEELAKVAAKPLLLLQPEQHLLHL